MKILIVNAYKNNSDGLKAFMGFRYLIQKILLEQTIVMDMESEFVIRRMEDLEDILYETTSSSNKVSSGRNFDSFDMIFISGEPHYRAWSKLTIPIQILVRMCLRARKFLFASGFAMETLVFQAATNFDRSITIINGDEGGKISEMRGFSSRLTSLAQQDFFLDHTTGDLYTYRNDQQEWSTKVNAGLHHSQAVQAYSTIGKFIVKAPVYRPNNKISSEISSTLSSGGQGVISMRTEVRCFIKTQYNLHWAFQGMTGNSFIAQKRSKWDIHPFSFMCKETSFVALAESDYGPLIIQFDDFILGCQYEIVPKYFESIIPMKNFVYNKLHMIAENRQSKLSILSAVENVSSVVLIREIMSMNKAKTKQRYLSSDKIATGELMYSATTPGQEAQAISSRRLQGDKSQNNGFDQQRTFRNSGFAASKKNIGILVSENALNSGKIKVKGPSDNVGLIQWVGLTSLKINCSNQFGLTILQSCMRLKQKKMMQSGTMFGGSNNLLSFEDILTARLKELGLDENENEQADQEEEPLTKGQVRRMLHPFLTKECYLENGGVWMPGMLKVSERKAAIRVKMQDTYKGPYYKQIVREEGVLPRSLSVMNLRRTGQTPQRRPSIFINEPYKSQAEQNRDYERKEAEKNIGPTKLDFSIHKSRVHSTLNPIFSNISTVKEMMRTNSQPNTSRVASKSSHSSRPSPFDLPASHG